MSDLIEVSFDQAYAPAEAERGKFAVIDTSTITDYPSASRGRYAVLTYQLNAAPLVLSGGQVYVDNVIVDNVRLPVSAIILEPDMLWIGSQTIPLTTSVTPVLPATLREIEIQNKTEGSVYFLASATTYNNCINFGIEIPSLTYYTTKKRMDDVTIASISGGDVRIMGHYMS